MKKQYFIVSFYSCNWIRVCRTVVSASDYPDARTKVKALLPNPYERYVWTIDKVKNYGFI